MFHGPGAFNIGWLDTYIGRNKLILHLTQTLPRLEENVQLEFELNVKKDICEPMLLLILFEKSFIECLHTFNLYNFGCLRDKKQGVLYLYPIQVQHIQCCACELLFRTSLKPHEFEGRGVADIARAGKSPVNRWIYYYRFSRGYFTNFKGCCGGFFCSRRGGGRDCPA